MPKRSKAKSKTKDPCFGWWPGHFIQRGFKRHNYTLVIDSDGNYRYCTRCGQVSFRLAVGERDRVR